MADSYVACFQVSTAGQGRSDPGIAAQQAIVSRFSANKRGEVVESFTEIESGKKHDRSELKRALRRCRLTGAELAVAKRNQLSRDAGVIYRLREASNGSYVGQKEPFRMSSSMFSSDSSPFHVGE